MQILSYGIPLIPNGYSNVDTFVTGRRKYIDCDACNADHWICICDDDDDDCDPVFCGYDRGVNDYDSYCYCDEDDCDCHCEYDKQ